MDHVVIKKVWLHGAVYKREFPCLVPRHCGLSATNNEYLNRHYMCLNILTIHTIYYYCAHLLCIIKIICLYPHNRTSYFYFWWACINVSQHLFWCRCVKSQMYWLIKDCSSSDFWKYSETISMNYFSVYMLHFQTANINLYFVSPILSYYGSQGNIMEDPAKLLIILVSV